MCTRTVIEIEKCKSNPKFETVALIPEKKNPCWKEWVSTKEPPHPLLVRCLLLLRGKGEGEANRPVHERR